MQYAIMWYEACVFITGKMGIPARRTRGRRTRTRPVAYRKTYTLMSVSNEHRESMILKLCEFLSALDESKY